MGVFNYTARKIRDIKFPPPEDKDKMWSALMYLYGIDIQDKPGEYLHTKEDIKIALNDKFERYS